MIVAVVVLAAGASFYIAGNAPATDTSSPIVATNSTETYSGPKATVKITSVTGTDTSNLAAVGDITKVVKTVKWQASNFPSQAGIDVNLLEKVSDSPVSFDFIRKIASGVPNTGSVTWTPKDNEATDDLYIEVVCSNPTQFKTGCAVTGSPVKAF